MRDNHGTFTWSAFDPNRWDHYTHAGQQVRFYRMSPSLISGSAFYGHTPIRKRRTPLVYRALDAVRRIFA